MTLKSQRIIAAVKADPTLTAKSLATMNSCSKQHVYSVLSKEGMTCAEVVKQWTAPENPRTVPAKIKTADGAFQVNTCVSGSIGELLVAADLMARGWKVFFPLFRSHSDLIGQSPDGKKLIRIEARSARRSGGELKYNRKAADICEHYALIIEGEPIIYVPPFT